MVRSSAMSVVQVVLPGQFEETPILGFPLTGIGGGVTRSHGLASLPANRPLAALARAATPFSDEQFQN